MGVFEQQILDKQEHDEFWKKSRYGKFNSRDGEEYLVSQFSVSLSNRFKDSNYLFDLKTFKVQPVIKIISKQTGAVQVRRLIDYITRETKEAEEKLQIETDQGQLLKNRDEREIVISEWREDFFDKEKYKKQEWKLEVLDRMQDRRDKLEKKSEVFLTRREEVELDDLHKQINGQYKIQKITDKQTGEIVEKKKSLKIRGADDSTHILLSVGSKPDQERATFATRKFLKENLGAAGFSYMFVRHDDTSNLHFHVVVKNKNLFNKRLRFDKADLFILRQEYARCLTEMGIERVATKRIDRTETLEKIKKDLTNFRENDTWYRNQLKQDGNKEESRDFDVFAYRSNLLRKSQQIIKSLERTIKNPVSSDDKKILKEDLHHLKIFKEEVKKITPQEFEIAQQKTINALSKDNRKLREKILELTPYSDNKKELTEEQKKLRKDSLKELVKRNIKSLGEAKEEIIYNLGDRRLTEEQRKRSVESLSQVNLILKETKKLEKEQSKFLGMFR